MEDFNSFKKNAARKAKILAAGALTSLPNPNMDQVPEHYSEDAEAIEITDEKPDKTDTLEPNTVKYEDYMESQEDVIVSREKLATISQDLKNRLVEKLPDRFARHHELNEGKNKPVYTHDHEILALTNNPSFDIKNYIELASQSEDSLFYKNPPKMTIEAFSEGKGYLSEEKRVEAENALREEYRTLTSPENTSSELSAEEEFYKSLDEEEYVKRKRKWMSAEKSQRFESMYEEYLNDNEPRSQELHKGSTAYALLRSGNFEKLQQDPQYHELLKNILQDINNPMYYRQDSLTGEKIFYGNGYLSEVHEVAWIMATRLELEKRGLSLDDYLDEDPQMTIEELAKINEKNLDFSLDHLPHRDKIKKYNKENTEYMLRTKSACEGSHALHASIMFDLYQNDTAQLEQHLDIARSAIETALEKMEHADHSNESHRVVHDLSHWLLGFTELPDDYELDQETKSTAQRAITKLLEHIDHEKNDPDFHINDMSHTIDILENLPDCLLEK
jgi:hypothetical protein